MSDTSPRLATTPLPPAARVASVKSVAGWMPWVGLVITAIWWGAVAASLVTVFDINAIAQQPPVTLVGGALIAILPGLLILMASFMARESARAAAANTLVLEAASQLLDPSEAGVRKASVLAARMAASSADIETAIADALSSMKVMSGELGDERLRLESVSYAAADNARDLARQLAGERSALENLIRELRGQGDTLNEAIPRQAALMAQAARSAAEEIGKADEALDRRLLELRDSSSALAGEVARLNGFAEDANRQGHAVSAALAQAEARLERARETVEAAIRASDAAIAAASGVGAGLQATVSATLDQVRRAAEAAPPVQPKPPAPAPQSTADLLRRSIATPATPPVPTASRQVQPGAPAPAPAPMAERPLVTQSPPARPADPYPANGAGTYGQRPSNSPLFAAPPQRSQDGTIHPTPPGAVDDELFDMLPRTDPPRREPPVQPERSGLQVSPSQPTGRPVPPPFDPIEELEPETQPNALHRPLEAATGDADPRWSSILSDMDRSQAGQADQTGQHREDLSREETAESVIRRLESAGVPLANVFRPKDKKKIAAAARKGDHQRRLAIQSTARDELERVASRVRRDGSLANLARDFVTMEAQDAIAALERTQGSNRNASPRLSAFLLLDAAMGG